MKVYELQADVNLYQRLLLKDIVQTNAVTKCLDLMQLFIGHPISDTWTPIEVEIIYKDLLPSDYPCIMLIPALSQRAVTALSDLLQENGEILPLICSEGVYFTYNITCVVDVLDEEHSEDPGFGITRYAFRPERMSTLSIFKLPQQPLVDVYVTDIFVERVQETGLVGFKFTPIWSDS